MTSAKTSLGTRKLISSSVSPAHYHSVPFIRNQLWPWITSNLRASPSITQLLLDIEAGKAIAVSDGSYFKQFATAAAGWILSSDDGCEWIEGGGIVPEATSGLHSYKAELGVFWVLWYVFLMFAPLLLTNAPPPQCSGMR